VNSSDPCCKILLHVKNPAECERDILSTKSTVISRQVSSALPICAYADPCQRALVD
jgi:hypothetical protein